MQRQLVSTEELVKLVNQRVLRQAKTGACAIAGVLRLHKPTDDGCNWEEIGVRGTHTPAFRQAVKESRAAYNLEDGLSTLLDARFAFHVDKVKELEQDCAT